MDETEAPEKDARNLADQVADALTGADERAEPEPIWDLHQACSTLSRLTPWRIEEMEKDDVVDVLISIRPLLHLLRNQVPAYEHALEAIRDGESPRSSEALREAYKAGVLEEVRGLPAPLAHEALRDAQAYAANVLQEAAEQLAVRQNPSLETLPILKNAAWCAVCETEVESRSRHDFRSCPCGSLQVDGGKAYLKRGWRGPGRHWEGRSVHGKAGEHEPDPDDASWP